MQNDLISRQAVIDLLQKNMSNDIQDQIITENNINLICSIQTAYDVEKIMEQLEEHFNATDDRDARLAYHHAIEIVKAGGVNDD